ncbi:MAG: hypothetical protein KL863_16640 [Rhizobium sp.]|nr:hypothetical protein [Rhizobium sp.]
MVNTRLTDPVSLRPPSQYQHSSGGTSPLSVLEYELMAERADALGRAGLRAEAALRRLTSAATDEEREALTDAAATEVYALFIQREMCGLRNGRDVIARYGIPGAVVARLGVSRKTSPAGS